MSRFYVDLRGFCFLDDDLLDDDLLDDDRFFLPPCCSVSLFNEFI